MTINSLSLSFLLEHPKDAARALEKFDPPVLAEYLENVPVKTAATVLKHIVPSIATECLKQMPVEVSTEIVMQLGIERATALLRRMKEGFREQMIRTMSPIFANMTRLVLRYPEGTVGQDMSPNVFTVHQDMRVNEVITAIRNAADLLQHEVYVINDKQQLVGIVDVKLLLTSDDKEQMKAIMGSTGETLAARTSLNAVRTLPEWNHKERLPVLDHQGVFIGVLHRHSLHASVHDHERQDEYAGTALAVAELFWDACANLLTPDYDHSEKGYQDERNE